MDEGVTPEAGNNFVFPLIYLSGVLMLIQVMDERKPVKKRFFGGLF